MKYNNKNKLTEITLNCTAILLCHKNIQQVKMRYYQPVSLNFSEANISTLYSINNKAVKST